MVKSSFDESIATHGEWEAKDYFLVKVPKGFSFDWSDLKFVVAILDFKYFGQKQDFEIKKLDLSPNIE